MVQCVKGVGSKIENDELKLEFDLDTFLISFNLNYEHVEELLKTCHEYLKINNAKLIGKRALYAYNLIFCKIVEYDEERDLFKVISESNTPGALDMCSWVKFDELKIID